MGRLQDRVAIVTGSARGFGWFIAEALVAEGARIVITDIDETGVQGAVRS